MSPHDAKAADLDDLIEAIRFPTELPKEALLELVRREETSAPVLIQLLSDGLEAELDPEDQGVPYAMLLLAHMEHKAAFPVLARLARHPHVPEILGDMVTESLGRCLACTVGDDIPGLFDLVRDPALDEVLRGQAVSALVTLAAGDARPREQVLADLKGLLREAIETDSEEMAAACVVGFLDFPFDAEAEALAREAYNDLLDEDIYPIEDFEESVALGADALWARLQEDERFLLAVDAVTDSAWWACWDPDFDPDD